MIVIVFWAIENNLVYLREDRSDCDKFLPAQVSYRIHGRGYFSTSLFAGNKHTEIEGRGSHLKW